MKEKVCMYFTEISWVMNSAAHRLLHALYQRVRSAYKGEHVMLTRGGYAGKGAGYLLSCNMCQSQVSVYKYDVPPLSSIFTAICI